MTEPTGPVHTAWHAALLLLGSCLVLWLCVQLLESIWPWLLGGLLVGLLVVALTLWIRKRRSRW